MASSRLDEDAKRRLVGLIDSTLRRFPCPMPREGETEPLFTAHILLPQVRLRIQELGIQGVTATGDGSARPTPTYLLGHRFYPDMSVSYFGERLVAYEVKFLRQGGRSNAISTALGQCLLYQLDRYPRVRAVLIDTNELVDHEDLQHCASLFANSGDTVEVIYRRAMRLKG